MISTHIADDLERLVREFIAVDLEQIDAAVTLISKGRRLFFIGNGGSAALASHMALDFSKNANKPALAFNDASFLTALGNDFGYNEVFAKPIEWFGQNGDVLIAISASGASPNVLTGVSKGNEVGLWVITLSGFKPDNPLRQQGFINFYVPSMSYGHVEVTHHAILHTILNEVIRLKNAG